MKPPARRRTIWACALLLSLLVHGLLLGPEISLPEFERSQDALLARKKAEAVHRVRLDVHLQSRHKAGVATVFIGHASRPAAKPVAAVARHRHKAARPTPPEALATSGMPMDAAASAAIAANPLPTATSQPDTPPAAPAASLAAAPAESAATAPEALAISAPLIKPAEPPVFPSDAVAVYRLHAYGVGADIRQTWHMDGARYRLEYAGSKFTFKFRMVSMGSLAPEGLQPELFQVFINERLTNAAQFNHEQALLIYGKPGDPRHGVLEPFGQDMASLPYHVAVSYSGSGQQHIQLTTGNALYNLQLHLESEDMLDLPAGKLRTLHLSGSRRTAAGVEQAGYDVWLAPDYLNFPVQFRGPDSRGKIVEFSLKALEFAGKPQLGAIKREAPAVEETDTLPPELENR